MGFLRLILALSVFLYHAGSFSGYSGINALVAVHLFFIISGFYMALILTNKYSRAKRPYYRFITNRFLRIYPLYWIILSLSIFVHYVHPNYSNISTFFSSISSAIPTYIHTRKLSIIEDFTLLFRHDYLNIDTFNNDSLLVGTAWTLVLELTFYCIAPFVVFIKKTYLLLLTVSSIIVFYLIIQSTYYQSVPANLVFFLFGILAYRLYDFWYIKKNGNLNSSFTFALSLFFLCVIIAWHYLPDTSFVQRIVLKEWVLYILSIPFIPLLFHSFNNIPFNNFTAGLSYPIYISHYLAVEFLQNFLSYKITDQFFSAWALVITLLISLVLVYAVEKPIDRLRQRRSGKLKFCCNASHNTQPAFVRSTT